MASSSKSASTSASTSTADDNTYCAFDVFLNHRGSDGKTFAIHLYNRLTSHPHLRVFLDRDEMEKGEELTPQISGAIRASSVNIAIFSPKYCESSLCLNELLLMLECKRTKGSTILPIFFHVQPSVLRWTEGEKGVYGQALSSLQNKKNSDSQPRYDPEIIRKWKDALHHVAGISGFELDWKWLYNGDESELLKDVVERVLKLVPKPPLDVSIYPTGLDIQDVLKMSYESLDDEEKKIFLDVACFFVGEEKDTTMMIWEDSEWAASLGLETLRNKQLVEVEVEAVWKDGVEYFARGWLQKYSTECMVECIRMHDQLRDMGRSLADKESWLRRIWSVTENLSDLSPVEGIRDSAERDRRVAALRRRAPNYQGSCVEGVFNVEQPPQLILLRCYNCPDSSLAPNISTKNLKFLHIEGSNLETLWHLESQAPRELRELYIDGSRLPKIPQSIGQLRRLEKVVFRTEQDIVSFETLPDEFCQLQSLKHLELHEKGLKSLPESVGDLSNLQHLNLAGCTCLEELPDSCGNLTKLQHIDLSSCMKLRLLPDSLGNLTSLQYINLSECEELETLPNTFGNLIQLKFLSLSGCQWLTVPSEALGNITTLEHLNLAECFAELPPQLTSQQFLQELYLTSSELPEAIGNLSNLKILSVESYDLEMLPSSFGALWSLEELEFEGCPFKCFPEPIRMLTQLKKLALRSMDLKITEWLSGLPTTLETLEIWGCKEMEELSGLERLESLEDLQIVHCDGLKRIHGLAQLTKLQTLDVQSNEDLEELPGIEGSQSLKKVNAFMCPKLKQEYKTFTENL